MDIFMKIKNNKVLKIFMFILVICLMIIFCLYLWKVDTDTHIYETPVYEKTNLKHIIEKTNLTENDYQFIYQQTGLGESAVNKLIYNDDIQNIYNIQNRFFKKVSVECKKTSIISWEEKITNVDDKIFFADIQAGDVLITPCSHTFGWRNGHAAIVIDETKMQTLESVVLGQKSSIQSVEKWKEYPCVIVLRAKHLSKNKRKEIANNAYKKCLDIDYGFDMGFLTPKFNEELLNRTHCAHLVWYAYKMSDCDLDSDGGVIVTPKDIANSSELEVVQIVGINPLNLWK